MARYRENLGSDKVIDDLRPLLVAAADGRVKNLFVAENEHVWGEFDRQKRQVTVKDQATQKRIELLDEAVFWALNNRGKVYIKKHDDMPVDAKVCAQLRY
ncbi:MAG: hypothetical protein ACWGOX_01220 [Desulforhopalus sp.]